MASVNMKRWRKVTAVFNLWGWRILQEKLSLIHDAFLHCMVAARK